MKHTESTKAICPYYKHEDSQVIYCEYPEINTVIHVAFADRIEARDFKLRNCRSFSGDCLIRKMLDEFFENKMNCQTKCNTF